MQKIGIIFKSSVPYSQEQNDISKQFGRTSIINMTRATILERNIDNDL